MIRKIVAFFAAGFFIVQNLIADYEILMKLLEKYYA